ncbi:unnamed protein product, partial [Medioppia subpectinata]
MAQNIDEMNESLSELRLHDNSDDKGGHDFGEGTSCGYNRCRSDDTQDMPYMNDSMDRFGDDLMELILSYLP